MSTLWLCSFIIIMLVLFYQRASLSVWIIAVTLFLVLFSRLSSASWITLSYCWTLFALIIIPLQIKSLRRNLITKHILPIFRKLMPTMSRTEKEALAAGTVGWDGELFSGNPDWQKLQQYPSNKLSAEEQAFIDGPLQQACHMIDDWDITQVRADLSPALWQFLKTEGFFALIIPKQYGGKAFSAYAHSIILQKLYGRSATVASTVAVPNSLGPAELLLHYGTQEQKDYYLPRLANGEEIPCFALTGPEAGSDAGAIPDTGIICQGQFQGKEILGIRLNWDKRYITLAPVATVLGLAFKLYDPELLLGTVPELGITCALIPTNTPGITIGRRHYPLNIVFQNGPTQGRDVFIPLDWIIGGPTMAGHGWRMLVECLSAGRAISLPSNVLGGAKAAALASGAYARIRRQFKQPIGYFEGIEEALARLAGFTYLLDAGSKLAMSAIDAGEKPAVISAIMKYHTTERCRQLIIDAMDIHGGKGICLGPRNYLGRMYQGAPISITVEGANILTRNMIIFGQGAIRCHPYVLAELEAAQENNPQLSLAYFDKALFGHINFTLSNIARSLLLGISNGRLALFRNTPAKRYYQQLTRFSAAFALIADVAMLFLGGKLKRKERISARLGDVLSMLYLGSAVLKHYADRDFPAEEKILVDWSCQTLLLTIQQQLDQILKNFPSRTGALLLRCLIFPLGKHLTGPSDIQDHQLAQLLLTPSALRQWLTQEVDTTPIVTNPIGVLEKVFELIVAAEPLYAILQKAQREGLITGNSLHEQLACAQQKNILTDKEIKQIQQAEEGRQEIIAVDDFDAGT